VLVLAFLSGENVAAGITANNVRAEWKGEIVRKGRWRGGEWKERKREGWGEEGDEGPA
jgi:hypothetical protein